MPVQNEPAFQSSSSPHSQQLSRSSRPSAIYSVDRNTRSADSSSCNVLQSLQTQPAENLSFESASRSPREDMSREGQDRPTQGSSAVPVLEQALELELELELDPNNNATAAMGDLGPDTDAALSALMALPQYPSTITDNESNVPVSEVINAVIEHGDFFRRHNTPHRETAGHNLSPPVDLYMSDSEMTDALSELGGVSLNVFPPREMGMADASSLFFDGSMALNNNSAISEGTAEDTATDIMMEYVPQTDQSVSFTTLNDDPDDTGKFYMHYGDSEYEERSSIHDLVYDGLSHLSDVDFDDFYRGHDHNYNPQVADFDPSSSHEDHSSFFPEGEDGNGADLAPEPHLPDSLIHGTTQERNFSIDQFISQWLFQSSTASIPIISLASPALSQSPISNIIRWTPPGKILRPSTYSSGFFDLQQIPWWEKLRVKRADARHLRDQWYTPYRNLPYTRRRSGARLSEEEFYFQGKSMYTEHKATIEHFQLRNLMSVPAYNTVHFAHESKVYSWVPAHDDLKCLIDLSVPTVESGFQGPVKISTMKTAQGITIAGGFFGEFAMRAAGTEERGVEGFVTKSSNGITTHIDIVPSRTSRSPMGIFASNDQHIRVLDCETNTFLADYELSHAVNCTSTSPDGRLRVVIGDSTDAWVVEADTGRPVHPLRGHRDFGFACAWSPDMRQIATSNQDKTAIIWDARMWRMLEKIESDVAGYRSLRFSPVGGGSRTLMLCEPADRIVIVNAQTYRTRQVHDFFGEVGGADYSPDGSTIWVSNTDEHFGGFMEYDRRQWGQRYGLRDLPNEWVRESDLDEDERCLLSERERQMRFWWNLSDEEHEKLLF